MMRVSQVSYRKTVSKNYNSESAETTIDVAEGDDVAQAQKVVRALTRVALMVPQPGDTAIIQEAGI